MADVRSPQKVDELPGGLDVRCPLQRAPRGVSMGASAAAPHFESTEPPSKA